jgi:hypothetical protein
VGYNPHGVTIATWGFTGLLTDGAIAKYCAQANGGDLYTAVSMDSIKMPLSPTLCVNGNYCENPGRKVQGPNQPSGTDLDGLRGNR